MLHVSFERYVNRSHLPVLSYLKVLPLADSFTSQWMLSVEMQKVNFVDKASACKLHQQHNLIATHLAIPLRLQSRSILRQSLVFLTINIPRGRFRACVRWGERVAR